MGLGRREGAENEGSVEGTSIMNKKWGVSILKECLNMSWSGEKVLTYTNFLFFFFLFFFGAGGWGMGVYTARRGILDITQPGLCFCVPNRVAGKGRLVMRLKC